MQQKREQCYFKISLLLVTAKIKVRFTNLLHFNLNLILIIFFPDFIEEDDDRMSIRVMLSHPRTIVNSIVVIMAASVWSVLDPTLEPHLRVVSTSCLG